jgi:hypothetical protein
MKVDVIFLNQAITNRPPASNLRGKIKLVESKPVECQWKAQSESNGHLFYILVGHLDIGLITQVCNQPC